MREDELHEPTITTEYLSSYATKESSRWVAHMFCPVCKRYLLSAVDFTEEKAIERLQQKRVLSNNYCSNCGARLREDSNGQRDDQ